VSCSDAQRRISSAACCRAIDVASYFRTAAADEIDQYIDRFRSTGANGVVECRPAVDVNDIRVGASNQCYHEFDVTGRRGSDQGRRASSIGRPQRIAAAGVAEQFFDDVESALLAGDVERGRSIVGVDGRRIGPGGKEVADDREVTETGGLVERGASVVARECWVSTAWKNMDIAFPLMNRLPAPNKLVLRM